MPRRVAPAVAPGSLALQAQPVLPAAWLVLRPWRASDELAVVAAYAEPDIQRWHARSMTEAEARAWISSWSERWNQERACGGAIATDSAVLGQINLLWLNLQDGVGEVSYWVLAPARGRGVATAGLATLSAWAFDHLGLHRIELTHSTGNPASCHVATKAGYRFEGVKRGEALHADGWHDMHLHALLSDDPRPK